MAAHFPRQPFACLDSRRLQSLQSTKNRQNAVTASQSHSSKLGLSAPTKRPIASLFEDDNDSENVDPAIVDSYSKRAKGVDCVSKKTSRFTLTPVSQSAKLPLASNTSRQTSTPVLSLQSQREVVASPAISSAPSRAVTARGGSPKHKRVSLLSKRRSTMSPYSRVDPPAFSRPSPLPFSLDAALSGTIPTYVPKKEANVEESMPNSWFFDIHEDTPEEEATNLMEHSACTLDISSDDDSETKLINEAKERGKENIPPPDYLSNSATQLSTSETPVDGTGLTKDVPLATSHNSKLRRKFGIDEMHQDRSPLSDLFTTVPDYETADFEKDTDVTSTPEDDQKNSSSEPSVHKEDVGPEPESNADTSILVLKEPVTLPASNAVIESS